MTSRSRTNLVIVFLASIALTLPSLFWVFPDQEELHTALFSTFYYARAFLSGDYPFWNHLVGFGTPQPFASNLILHPAVLLFSPDNPGLALFAFFSIQMFFGSAFTYLTCRKMGAGETPSLVGAITFLLCSTTTVSLFVKVMPTYALAWTIQPAILYAIVSITEDDGVNPGLWFKAVALGLLTGVLLADGHAGTYVNFGLSVVVFALAAAVKHPRIILPLMGAAVLGLLIAADKAYLLSSEIQLSLEFVSEQDRNQFYKPLGFFGFWSAFLKPLVPDLRPEAFIFRNVRFGGATDPIWTNLIFFGPPFALLALYTTFSRRLHFPWRRPLAIAAGFSLVMLLLPPGIHESIFVSSGNIIFIAPVILFSIPLAAVGLTKAAEITGFKSHLFLSSIATLQVGALVLGTLPYVFLGVVGNNHLGHGEVLQETRPVASYLKSIASHPESRVYLSPGVEKYGPRFLANWGGERGNAFAIWGMSQVNGYFKSAAMENFSPDRRLGESQIRGLADALVNKPMLDVLGIEFVLALDGEDRDPGLVEDVGFENEFGLRGRNNRRLVLLRNPGAWPQAIAFPPGRVDSLTLPLRNSCPHGGLLCRDFSSVRGSRLDLPKIRIKYSIASDALIEIDGQHSALTILVTQTYRPGWRATADAGDDLPVRRIMEGFLAIDVPAGVTRVELSYAPPIRVKLTILQAALLVLSVAFVMITIVLRRLNAAVTFPSNAPVDGPKSEEADKLKFGTLWRQSQWRRRVICLGLVALISYAAAYAAYRILLGLSAGEVFAEIVFYATFLLPVGLAVRMMWTHLPKTA